MRLTRAIFAVALVLPAGAAMADAAAERIIDAIVRSDALFYPDKTAPEVTLSGCALRIDGTKNPDVFGSLHQVHLGDVEVDPPVFIYKMSNEIWRLTFVETDAALAAQAPAIWRYMGGTDADRPSTEQILSKADEWDPLGLGWWSDPSFIKRWQQVLYDTAWERALNGEGGAELARSYSAWYGPAKGDWRPIWRDPGVYIQIGMAPDEVEPFVGILRDYIAKNCD